MHLQLKSIYHMEVNGRMQTFQPGDWLQIDNRATVERLVADNIAWSPQFNPLDGLPPDCGIVSPITFDLDPWRVTVSDSLELPYHHTLFLNPAAPFRAELFGTGFRLLKTWQVVCPLMHYDTLARDVGTSADQQRTAQAMPRGELRFPVYDTRLLYIRRCPDTTLLLTHWQAEEMDDADPTLAFMRALMAHPVEILALPFQWLTVDGRDGYDND